MGLLPFWRRNYPTAESRPSFFVLPHALMSTHITPFHTEEWNKIPFSAQCLAAPHANCNPSFHDIMLVAVRA